jgi:phage shock protein C
VAREAIVSRLLMRDTRRGVLGGVAAGFGDYLQVDPVLVRIGFVLLTFAHAIGLLLYAVCWVLMPVRQAAVAVPAAPVVPPVPPPSVGEEGATAAEPEAGLAQPATPATDVAAAQMAIGAILIVFGALLLGHNLEWFHWPRWLRFDTLWPLLIVALGLGLVARSRRGGAA